MKNLKGNVEESNFYHVYMRGLAKQIIFEEASDNKMFLYFLKAYSKTYNIKIISYCLMINHVHILCQDSENNIPSFMHILCSMYARYFNKKYERVGALFQRPYKKKLIKNDLHLLTVFRYIIKNPEKDGICPYQEYKWSSYCLFYHKNSLVDVSLVKDLLDGLNVDAFLKDDKYEENEEFYSDFEQVAISNSQAKELIKSKFNITSPSLIRCFNKQKRNEAVIYLKSLGLSIRQIERLTGVSRGISQNILKA